MRKHVDTTDTEDRWAKDQNVQLRLPFLTVGTIRFYKRIKRDRSCNCIEGFLSNVDRLFWGASYCKGIVVIPQMQLH